MEGVSGGGDGTIRVLPPDVADKIAAGEVVERPASVVKELVENALDAHARHIRIDLEEAGIGLIVVADDGDGMGAEDAVRAFQRHATSKVRCVDDLFRIRTLGFRGEALASIAAVSVTTLTTRRAAELGATRVVVRGSHLEEVCAVGAAPGTRIEVANLFGNTPARRKFLKAPATEVGHVSELVTRTALAWPRVSFSLRHGKRTLVEYPAVADAGERVAQVFGRDRAGALTAFHGRTAAGSIRGWLSGSHFSVPSARHIFTYVNGRYVRDKLVSHALVAGYGTLLMHGRYPAAAVFIDVPAEDVDVNVHPAKSEVRFRMGGAVHDLITRTVMDRLRAQAPLPAPALADETAPAHSTPPSQTSMAALLSRTGGWPGPSRTNSPLRMVPLPAVPAQPRALEPRVQAAVEPPPDAASLPAPDTSAAGIALRAPGPAATTTIGMTPATRGFFGDLRVIGQAFEGYVICENGSVLVVVDQHAAHERVTFERLRKAYAAGGVTRQRLLIPVIVDVGAQAAAALGEHLQELEGLGFELEPFGGGSLAVRGVPALLGDSDPAALVRDLADELAEIGRARRLTQAAESVLARLACHSAVRVGQSLGAEQIRALLVAMDGVDFAGNCPHGRPAFITLPRADLERLFRRT